MLADIKRCCKLSIYTYKAKQSNGIMLLDGLRNKTKSHDAQAILIRKNAHVYIAFRGTATVADFKDAINVKPVKTPYGIVHSGFYDQYLSLHDAMMEHILDTSNDISDIYFCGHSLGGAVAMISSAMMKFPESTGRANIIPRRHCYTFGAPVVGDKEFLTSVVDSCDSLRCIELKYDIIPQIPLHPTLERMTGKPFTMVVDPPSTTPPWDVWDNHSCVTYYSAMKNHNMS